MTQVLVPKSVNWEALVRDIDFLTEWLTKEWDTFIRWKCLGEIPPQWEAKKISKGPLNDEDAKLAAAVRQQEAFLTGMAVSPGEFGGSRL